MCMPEGHAPWHTSASSNPPVILPPGRTPGSQRRVVGQILTQVLTSTAGGPAFGRMTGVRSLSLMSLIIGFVERIPTSDISKLLTITKLSYNQGNARIKREPSQINLDYRRLFWISIRLH